MIDVEKRSYLKYFLFGSLYFTEGLYYIIGTIILPIYLTDKGIDLPIVTLIAAIFMLPMTIKFFWGGIVDYFVKYGRKLFIVLGGLLSVFSFIFVSMIDPSELIVPFALLLFFAGIGVSFLDVSADAWAIQISHENERGKINGAMFAGQSAGMVVGASFLSHLAFSYGYIYSFLATSLIVFFVIIFPLLIKEIKIDKTRIKIGSLLVAEFRKKTTLLVSIFTPLSALNVGLLGVLIPLYMKISLDMDITQIGFIITIWSATRVLGTIIYGAIADRWGRKIVLYFVLSGGCILSVLLIFADTWQILAFLYGLIGFLLGGHYSALGALLMDVTNPKVGATQYSVLTSLGNAGITISESLCGSMVSFFGFTSTFLYTAWFFGPALLLLHFIRLKKYNNKQV
jgi:MFS family permease